MKLVHLFDDAKIVNKVSGPLCELCVKSGNKLNVFHENICDHRVNANADGYAENLYHQSNLPSNYYSPIEQTIVPNFNLLCCCTTVS